MRLVEKAREVHDDMRCDRGRYSLCVRNRADFLVMLSLEVVVEQYNRGRETRHMDAAAVQCDIRHCRVSAVKCCFATARGTDMLSHSSKTNSAAGVLCRMIEWYILKQWTFFLGAEL